MRRWVALPCTVLVCVSVFTLLPGGMGKAQEVTFTPEFLRDPGNIAMGKQLWEKRCQFCHGKEAYPGSAPPLKPAKYHPDFVFDRITNGFRGMPALQHEFSPEERKAIVAYVLSPKFAP